MSGFNNRHKHKKVFNGKSFIILPIIFCLIIYTAVFAAIYPYLTFVSAGSNLFFSEGEKDYSTEYDNIFVPVSEDKNKDKDNKKKSVAIRNVQFPKYGDLFGEIIIEDCGIDNNLFFGDGEVSLRNGIGTYNGSFIPGYGRTILLAGHNNTYYNGLKNAKKGQEVLIRTSYGNYRYKIKKTAVKDAKDRSSFDLDADYENLIMYTCYPFDEIGLTEKRFFVYADYVSGPIINKEAR